MKQRYFLKMIQHLWEEEEVVLYGYLLNVSEAELKDVGDFLQKQYEEEAIGYPYQVPAFDTAAATWAAKLCYQAAQLLLYRENEEKDLPHLFKAYPGTMDAAAILSADLCLRFLPNLLSELKTIDPDDALIEILETILKTWHYSGINYDLAIEELDFEKILTNPCITQLYCNRIIHHKKIKLARQKDMQAFVLSSLGDYASIFWKELTIINNE